MSFKDPGERGCQQRMVLDYQNVHSASGRLNSWRRLRVGPLAGTTRQGYAVGAANAALGCGRDGTRLLHFPTNFVFDGRLDRPYIEKDEARPLGVYGRSKLDGEKAVLAALPDALVIRTAAVFGGQGSAIKG